MNWRPYEAYNAVHNKLNIRADSVKNQAVPRKNVTMVQPIKPETIVDFEEDSFAETAESESIPEVEMQTTTSF